MPETIIRPYEEKMVNSAFLEIPRNTYQRGLNPERVKRISHSFDERIANEPKVSLRDGHYFVFDGQHIVAARVDHNSGAELPIRCKVYPDLTEQDEAKLFANQTGFGVPPSIGMKLRALVFAGDPEAVSFLKANEEIGLKVDYGQHKGRNRIACIAASLTEFRKLGPERYQTAMKMIRRSQVYSQNRSLELTAGPFRVDLRKMECYQDGELVTFTGRELNLFRFLLENPCQVFSKEQLYRQIWDDAVVDDNTITVYIKRIRGKIERNPKKPVYLKTIRGIVCVCRDPQSLECWNSWLTALPEKSNVTAQGAAVVARLPDPE